MTEYWYDVKILLRQVSLGCTVGPSPAEPGVEMGRQRAGRRVTAW